jgi:signal transduction histidine kinase
MTATNLSQMKAENARKTYFPLIGNRFSLSPAIGIIILFGLYLTSLYNYLLFHSLAEAFSIVIAFGIFMVAWNSRAFMDNRYFLFIGIAYLFVGSLDLLHTLSYKGMNIFPDYDANLPTQLWISARYLESITLLIAPLVLGRKLKIVVVFSIFFLITILLLLSIFYFQIFPVCFREETGLSLFKKASEYIISIILILSIVLLLGKKHAFDPSILALIIAATITTIGSELSFTFYNDVYGMLNLIGHFLKIISFYFIYKAVIEIGLTKPYEFLFRNIKQHESELKKHKEMLEERVEEKTQELGRTNAQLLEEIHERKNAEHRIRERESALKKSRDDYRLLAGKLLTVQESERRRLAREMHDDLTQRLAVLAMDMGNLQLKFNDSPELVPEKLMEIQERMVKLSTDIHAISRQLHPSILDDLGLADAIESECRNFTQREGIRVNYVAKGIPPKLSKEIGLTIYRIIQEGLRNIAKHAEAEEAHVSLNGHNKSISLTIKDAGKGFNPTDPTTKQGLGLISMEERIRLLNGELSIQSSTDQGTVIEARVPVEDT